jgi:hypothetical protein
MPVANVSVSSNDPRTGVMHCTGKPAADIAEGRAVMSAASPGSTRGTLAALIHRLSFDKEP